MKEISDELYNELLYLGIINENTENNTRSYNVGASDYSLRTIQPWTIWIHYNLDGFDADIVKRVLRNKDTEPKILDYKKIIHICNEKIRQIEIKNKLELNDINFEELE